MTPTRTTRDTSPGVFRAKYDGAESLDKLEVSQSDVRRTVARRPLETESDVVGIETLETLDGVSGYVQGEHPVGARGVKGGISRRSDSKRCVIVPPPKRPLDTERTRLLRAPAPNSIDVRAKNGGTQLRVVGDRHAQLERERPHPLPVGHVRQNVADEVGSRYRHMAAPTRVAKAAIFAGERERELVPARGTT